MSIASPPLLEIIIYFYALFYIQKSSSIKRYMYLKCNNNNIKYYLTVKLTYNWKILNLK